MNVTRVDLRTEAIAEARRLAEGRALHRDGDERALASLEGDATWIAKPRRTSLKRSLGGRVCLLWRVAFEETSGRVVESKLVPVLVAVPSSADRRSSVWMACLLQHADRHVRASVEAECAAWRATVVSTTRAFARARLRREREIAGRPVRSLGDSQFGLFDRRAERTREAHESAAVEARQAAAVRLRAIRAAARIAPQPARLLLVLVS
jgi:hypothetical protein